jgi:hypothetical protein
MCQEAEVTETDSLYHLQQEAQTLHACTIRHSATPPPGDGQGREEVHDRAQTNGLSGVAARACL